MPEVIRGTDVPAILTESEGAQKMYYRDIFLSDAGHQVGVTLNDIQPGGRSKDHFHPGFHVTYVVSGSGVLKSGEARLPVQAGDVIYLASGEPHCYINTGAETMRLLGIK